MCGTSWQPCRPGRILPARLPSPGLTRGKHAMARVPYLEKTDLKPDDQDLLKRPIALFKALVNSPGGARAFSGLGQYIRFNSKLDPRLRELAILQVGYLARAPYEWSHHVKIGYAFGVTDADIEAAHRRDRGTRQRPAGTRPHRPARRPRNDRPRPRHVGRDLRHAHRPRCRPSTSWTYAGHRLLQRRGPRARHAADRRRARYQTYLDRYPLPAA